MEMLGWVFFGVLAVAVLFGLMIWWGSQFR